MCRTSPLAVESQSETNSIHKYVNDRIYIGVWYQSRSGSRAQYTTLQKVTLVIKIGYSSS